MSKLLKLEHIDRFEEYLERTLDHEGIKFDKTSIPYIMSYEPNKIAHVRYVDKNGVLITDYYVELNAQTVYEEDGVAFAAKADVVMGEWHYSSTDDFLDFFDDKELPDENRIHDDTDLIPIINSIIVAYNLRIGNKKPVDTKQKFKTANLVKMCLESIQLCLERWRNENATAIFVQPPKDKRSESYIKSKQKVLEQVGLNSITVKLPEDVDQKYVEKLICFLNKLKAPSLIQLPIPGINPNVVKKLDPAIDIDRFSYGCKEYDDKYRMKTYPCTPKGIYHIIKEYMDINRIDRSLLNKKYEFSNLTVTIIGRGELVGAPLSELLRDHGATVMIANSRTDRRTLTKMMQMSDVVVSATGHHGTISQDMLTGFRHKKLLIVDAGVSFIDGKLKGDFRVDEDYMWLYPNMTYTPCIGGVGPMTVVSVAANTATLLNNLDVLNNNYIRNVLKEAGYDYE